MISIIIPTKNEEKVITKTLDQFKHLDPNRFEVIVSDGNSKDGTLEILKNFNVKLTVYQGTGRQNISQGKNAGAALAKGDILVFVDADVQIPQPEDFFKKTSEMFALDPKLVGITVPMHVQADLATTADKVIFYGLNLTYRIFNNVLHSGNASGEFQMIRTSAFRQLNGYREDLAAGEDNDMFRRLAKIGKTRFENSLKIIHSGRRAHKIGWPKLLYTWLKNGLWVMFFNRSPYDEWKEIR